MTKGKGMWFFCQLLVAGGCMSQTLSLTSTEAQQHLDSLKKQEVTKRAYAVQIGVGIF